MPPPEFERDWQEKMAYRLALELQRECFFCGGFSFLGEPPPLFKPSPVPDTLREMVEGK